VELWRRNRDRIAKLVVRLLKNPEKFLYTTLVGTNIFNVAFTSYFTIYFNRFLDPRLTWLANLFLILVLGEIIPKTLFRSLADRIIRKVTYPLYLFSYLLFPAIWIVSKTAELCLFLFGYQKSELKHFFSRKDIEILLQESPGYIRDVSQDEEKFLKRFLELRELRVREAMVPRTEIVAISEDASLDELVELFENSRHTKIPVYRQDLDNIIGVVFLRDMFDQPEELRTILRPILRVPDTKQCLDLLKEFREKNATIAIAINEYGGTAGLVTAEDLVEELFGEIEDEDDRREVMIHKIKPNVFTVSARIEIEQLNEELGLNIPKGDYETLSGYILAELGHIPKVKEKFTLNGLQFIVSQATPTHLECVRLIIPRR